MIGEVIQQPLVELDPRRGAVFVVLELLPFLGREPHL
jgi:hypothetical protein